MNCPKCGNQNSDGLRFCRFCGTPLTAQNVEVNPMNPYGAVNPSAESGAEKKKNKKNKNNDGKKKSSKGLKAFLAIIVSLAVIIGAIAAVVLLKPESDLALALKRPGDVSGLKMDLKESHKAYERAEALYKNNNYKDAITEYSKVIKDDKNYNDAQEKIKSCSALYKEYVLSETEVTGSDEQYKSSIELLEEAVKVIPDDSELNAKLSTVKSEYAKYLKTNVMDNANQLIKDAKYADALAEIDNALKFITSDSDLTDLRDVCVNEYERSVIQVSNDLISENRYEAAIDEVESALTVLPNNENLTKQLNKIQSNKPVSLSTLTPINGGWEWNEGSPTDPFGTTYSNVSNYKIFEGAYNDEHYAEYRVYGKYKRFTASLIPHMDIRENGNSQVQIYADDKLVYTSPTIGRKTDMINVSADVSGAEYIKIVVQVKDNRDYDACNGLIMMDAQLWAQ